MSSSRKPLNCCYELISMPFNDWLWVMVFGWMRTMTALPTGQGAIHRWLPLRQLGDAALF